MFDLTKLESVPPPKKTIPVMVDTETPYYVYINGIIVGALFSEVDAYALLAGHAQSHILSRTLETGEIIHEGRIIASLVYTEV